MCLWSCCQSLSHSRCKQDIWQSFIPIATLGFHCFSQHVGEGPIKTFYQTVGLGGGRPLCWSFECPSVDAPRASTRTGAYKSLPRSHRSFSCMAETTGCQQNRQFHPSQVDDMWSWASTSQNWLSVHGLDWCLGFGQRTGAESPKTTEHQHDRHARDHVARWQSVHASLEKWKRL